MFYGQRDALFTSPIASRGRGPVNAALVCLFVNLEKL